MKKSIIIVLLLSLLSCKNDNNRGVIPNVFIDIQINLSNFEYQNLRTPGGFVNIEGGVKGIILYRNFNNQYLAFERTCPNAPNEDCARVSVDPSNLFIQCTCCSSQYNFEGSVISGPSPYPLKRYGTSINSNFLYIIN